MKKIKQYLEYDNQTFLNELRELKEEEKDTLSELLKDRIIKMQDKKKKEVDKGVEFCEKLFLVSSTSSDYEISTLAFLTLMQEYSTNLEKNKSCGYLKDVEEDLKKNIQKLKGINYIHVFISSFFIVVCLLAIVSLFFIPAIKDIINENNILITTLIISTIVFLFVLFKHGVLYAFGVYVVVGIVYFILNTYFPLSMLIKAIIAFVFLLLILFLLIDLYKQFKRKKVNAEVDPVLVKTYINAKVERTISYIESIIKSIEAYKDYLNKEENDYLSKGNVEFVEVEKESCGKILAYYQKMIQKMNHYKQ